MNASIQTEASGTQLRITIETLPTELTYDREGRQQWLARWGDATITYHDHLNELPAGVRAAAAARLNARPFEGRTIRK